MVRIGAMEQGRSLARKYEVLDLVFTWPVLIWKYLIRRYERNRFRRT